MKKHKTLTAVFILLGTVLMLLLASAAAALALSERNLYNPSPLDALTEWPGWLSADDHGADKIWHQQSVAGGIVYLYYHPLHTAQGADATCVSTTFVAPVKWHGWRAQSGSRLGCWMPDSAEAAFTPNQIFSGAAVAEYHPGWFTQQPSNGFISSFTVGGNITPLTVAYGLAASGQYVLIEWADGEVSRALVTNGTFLHARPVTTMVTRMSLIDSAGRTLAVD